MADIADNTTKIESGLGAAAATAALDDAGLLNIEHDVADPSDDLPKGASLTDL